MELDTIHNTDALTYLRTLPDESVHLADELAVGVGVAVYPQMARATEGNEIVGVQPQFWMFCPRLDVVSMKGVFATLLFATPRAGVIITSIDEANDRNPFTRRIDSLAFRRIATTIVRIVLAAPAVHPVPFTAQIWLRLTGRNRQRRACFVSVMFAQKRVWHTFALHVAVFTLQILTARACWNAVALQPLKHLLGIATNYLADVVGTQSFDQIFLAQPHFVNRLLRSLPMCFAVNRTETRWTVATPPDFLTAPLAS